MNHRILILIILTFTVTTSCEYFKTKDSNYIDIPEGLTDEQLQEQRYAYKRDKSYREKFLQQSKTDSAIVTIYSIIDYKVKDETENISEGFSYLIVDLSVDNFTNQPFYLAGFIKSCHLSNSSPEYAYSNVSYALKMYHLQSDSSEIDMSNIQKFFQETMPPKEFYRAKLFAYEVSRDDKEPLFFNYKIGNQKFEYKVRDKQY